MATAMHLWTRTEALDAARMDSTYLVSPTARRNALAALEGDASPEADAARVILVDGGQQQGQFAGKRICTMVEWRDAVAVLEGSTTWKGGNQ